MKNKKKRKDKWKWTKEFKLDGYYIMIEIETRKKKKIYIHNKLEYKNVLDIYNNRMVT